MPHKIFGVDLRLPSPQNERVRPGKISPTTSVTELRRPSMDQIKANVQNLAKRSVSNDKKSRSLSKDRSISKDKHAKESRTLLQQKAVKLGMVMESPPVVFIGSNTQSTGALISGRIQVTPSTPEATIEEMSLYLECWTGTKRPVSERCRECLSNVTDIAEWKFFSKPRIFWQQDGMQEMPFSHMIPGHLPATTHGQVGSIDYSLHVKARTSDGQDVELRRELIIKRALVPGPDKHSIRIFPPTNLQLQVTLPSVIYPMGEFPVECKMTGISATAPNGVKTRWRLRKVTWRIEEIETMVSKACSKHAAKVGGEGKGIQHEQTREIGWEELQAGWKTDFDEGSVEGEFKAGVDAKLNPQCDMSAQNGLEIKHNFIMELVIAEEWVPQKHPHKASPTGAARVLRTQFALNMTERAGLGLAWDDEIPPSYEDVPDSPPHYQNQHTTIQDYEGDDIHDDVERLNLNG